MHARNDFYIYCFCIYILINYSYAMSKIFILLRDSDIYPFFTGERQFTKIQQDSLLLKSIQIFASLQEIRLDLHFVTQTIC